MSTKKLTDKARKNSERLELGARIGLAIDKSGVNQKVMADKIGVHPTELNRWIKGNRAPFFSRLPQISRLVNVNLDWLMTGEGDSTTPCSMRPGGEAGSLEKIGTGLDGLREVLHKMQREEIPVMIPELVGKMEKLDLTLKGIRKDRLHFPSLGDREEPPEGFVMVPRYDGSAAAGSGSLIDSEQLADSMAFRSAWIRELGLRPDALALISTRGDSMTPTLRPGDMLLIDLSGSAVREDAIYAIHNDGGLVVKRVQKLCDGSIVIKSDNPAYQNQTVEKERLETVRIVGRVVWVGRRL